MLINIKIYLRGRTFGIVPYSISGTLHFNNIYNICLFYKQSKAELLRDFSCELVLLYYQPVLLVIKYAWLVLFDNNSLQIIIGLVNRTGPSASLYK